MEQETDEVGQLRDWIVRVEGRIKDCEGWKFKPPGGSTQQWRQENDIEIIQRKRDLEGLKRQYYECTGRHYPQ